MSVPRFKENSAVQFFGPVSSYLPLYTLYNYKKLNKKLVLGHLNGQEMFNTPAMKVIRNLKLFVSFSCYNFQDLSLVQNFIVK